MSMSILKFALPVAAAAALVLLPGSGDAQSRAGASADAPVMWGADNVTYRADGVLLEGRAEILQGDNRMRASRLNITADANGQLTRVEASGDVYYVTPAETMRGDSAVYTVSDDTVVVSGDVILTQGENVMTGGRLTYNLRTGEAQIAGGANGRVQGVFHPQRTAR